MATPTTSSQRRRPPQLDLADDKTKHDIILQIVLPIAPLAVSGEMLQTLRLSDSIRQKQSSLIAAAAAASALSAGSSATSATSVSMPSADDAAVLSGAESADESDLAARAPLENNKANVAEPTSPALERKSDRKPSSIQECTLSSDHEEDADRDHFRLGRTSKRIRREKAPKPLRLALPMSSLPMISSAPLRTFGHPSLYPSRGLSRRFYPPQYVPMTAVVATPVQRMVRVRDTRGIKPRKAFKGPVRDVFIDEQVRPAPISSQPLSAQKEHFSLSEDERDDDELRLKSLEGAITFNEEAHYRFRIFDDNAAKEKFMKICETTWDKYVQSGQGAHRR